MVILDRDDTLVALPVGRRYQWGDAAVVFMPGAVEFVRALNATGIWVVVATNQRGIALEQYPEMTLEAVQQFHDRIQTTLSQAGAHVDRFYVCPHAERDRCECRKPLPGMVQQALLDFEVDPHHAAAIGDQPRDLAAAAAAGLRRLYLITNDEQLLTTALDSAGSIRRCLLDCLAEILATRGATSS